MSKDKVSSLFLIPGLANVVMQFVPKLQMRQWIRDSSGTQQAKLVAWMPKEDQDETIVKAIVLKDNVHAYCNLQNKLQLLYIGAPCVSIVKHMMRTKPEKVLFSYLSFPNLADDVFESFMSTQYCDGKMLIGHVIKTKNAKRLNMLLELCQEVIEIGHDLGSQFEIDIWDVVQPYLLSNRVTIQSVSTHFLKSMAIGAFLQIPSTINYDKRMLFEHALLSFHWPLAAHVFELEYSDMLRSHLEFLVDIRVSPDFLLTNVSMEFPSQFACLEKWYSCPCLIEGDMMTLNDFLKQHPFGQKNEHKQWQEVTTECVNNFLIHRPLEEKWWIFERACMAGFESIVFCIWNSISVEQQQQIRQLLSIVCFCSNGELYDFAWQHNSETIRMHALQWIRCAFNNNNIVLWKFLYHHALISQDLLFENQDIAIPSHLETCPNLFLSLAYKPAKMLERVWDDCTPTQHQKNTLLRLSFLDCNEEVLNFLDARNVDIDCDYLGMHFSLIRKFNLRNFLMQINNAPCIPQDELFHVYLMEGDNIYFNHIWSIVPLKDPAVFLAKAQHPTLEICLFLLQKKCITLHSLLTILKTKDNCSWLLDEIHAFTYCEVDN